MNAVDDVNIFELYTESAEQPQMHVDNFGIKRWRLNTKLHRIDGPAIEYPNGSKEWYHNGRMHRVDGPAGEYSDGSKTWYIRGVIYTDINKWAQAALKYEGKEPTDEMIEQKMQQVMQQDLFS